MPGPATGPGLAYRNAGDQITVEAVNDVITELHSARSKFASFNNAHEGYAVILEELDELWEDVKRDAPWPEMRAEAMQVAAMAIRFMVDLGKIKPG